MKILIKLNILKNKMETKYCQGKSKDKQDATEFMAFIGVVGMGISLMIYFIYILIFLNI